MQKFLHRQLAFTEDDEVGSCLQIFLGVSARLRAADDGGPSSFASDTQDVHDVAARHQIRIDTEHGRLFGSQVTEEKIASAECGVKNVHIEASRTQVRAEVENTQRRVGLKNLQFLWVVEHEVAVRQEEIRHSNLPRSC